MKPEGEVWREQYGRMMRARLRILPTPKYSGNDIKGLHLFFTRYSDDVLGFFMHAWHLKDWLKSDSSIPDVVRQRVEAEVAKVPVLLLCADLANSAKHFDLRRSRAGAGYAAISFTRHESNDGPEIEPAIYLQIRGSSEQQDIPKVADQIVDAWHVIFRTLGLIDNEAPNYDGV